MSQEAMKQARELIKARRYDEARAILRSLDTEIARQWLVRLDALEAGEFPNVKPADQPKVQYRKYGPSCLKMGFSVGCVAPILFVIGACVLCVILGIIVGADEVLKTENAIRRNASRGSLELPIAAGEWAVFDSGKIRATRMIRPATSMVKRFNMFNDDPPAGTDWVLVWFEVVCGEDRCTPQLDIKLRLVDNTGKEWSEPILMVLEDDLDGQEAIKDAAIAGWQAFAFPADGVIRAIWMKWDSETLHVLPPPVG